MINQVHLDSSLSDGLKHIIVKILKSDSERLKEHQTINENNIFQEAVKHNRQSIFPFIKECLLEKSQIVGAENWAEFFTNFQNGKSSVILSEHKSNLDVVIFYYLMTQIQKNEEFDKISFIAGRKLNEESITVRLFAEMFNRLVVVPKSETQGADEAEMREIYKINYAAQQFLKQNLFKHIYLIYPTGTRSRIYEPETYKGITETVNYLEKFDQVIFLSADGNCMFPLPNVPMDSEPIIKDNIVLKFSKPLLVKDYIHTQKIIFEKQSPEGSRQDFKVFLTNAITETIYSQKPIHPTKESWTELVKNYLDENNIKV